MRVSRVVSGYRTVRAEMPRGWREPSRALGANARFREELGLDPARPIVMAGHQAEAWHAGILAKRLALGGVGPGARAAWIVVDQDANESAGRVRYPGVDARGVVVAREWVFGPARAGVPTGMAPAAREIPACPTDGATEDIARGLARLGESLAAHAGSATLAMQVAGAVESLVPRDKGACTLVSATRIGGTALFAEVVARMERDPDACIGAYNAAAVRHPGAEVRALEPGELPLWRVEPGRARGRAEESSAGRLVPRALLMTGLLRWAGCDVFVHGTGGEAYDRVTAEWLGEWLGVELAPAGMVTATCVPTRDGRGVVTEREAAEAAARATRARHDPAIVGDEDAARAKGAMVEEIARVKGAGGDPAGVFARMQAMLEEYRERRAEEIGALDRAAARAAAAVKSAAVWEDRTWSWVLLGEETVDELHAAVAGAI